jgi:hypothetical protein
MNTRQRLITGSLVLISTLACAARTAQRDQVPPDATQPDVAAVYAAVISAETPSRPGAPILVAPTTRPQWWDTYGCRPTTTSESDPWRSAIDNYIAVSTPQTETSIPPILPLPRSRYRLLGRPAKSCEKQKPFGFIQVSRVGFDTTGTRAIVHRIHACSCLECGDGSDLFLQK